MSNPFSTAKVAALAIHGWTCNGSGTQPVHMLRSGKALVGVRRRDGIAWCDTPRRAGYVGTVYPTQDEATAAFRVKQARHAP